MLYCPKENAMSSKSHTPEMQMQPMQRNLDSGCSQDIRYFAMQQSSLTACWVDHVYPIKMWPPCSHESMR